MYTTGFKKKKKYESDTVVEPSQVTVVGPVDLNQSVTSSVISSSKGLAGESARAFRPYLKAVNKICMVGNNLNCRIKPTAFFVLTYFNWEVAFLLDKLYSKMLQEEEPTFGPTDCTPVSYHDLHEDAASSSEADLKEEERLLSEVTTRLLEVSVLT